MFWGASFWSDSSSYIGPKRISQNTHMALSRDLDPLDLTTRKTPTRPSPCQLRMYFLDLESVSPLLLCETWGLVGLSPRACARCSRPRSWMACRFYFPLRCFVCMMELMSFAFGPTLKSSSTSSFIFVNANETKANVSPMGHLTTLTR